MFNILFDSSFWYDVLIALVIVAVIWLIVTHKEARIYVYWVLFIVVTALTSYCIVQTVGYYTARGGIYGDIGDLDSPNEIVVVSEYEFDVRNIILTEQGKEYSATMTANVVLELDPDSGYGLFVNNLPCISTEYATDYITGEYRYNFYNSSNEVVCYDTLTLNLAFNQNYMSLKISTEKAEAVSYWQSYFNKNNFVVKISKLDDLDDDVKYGEGDISNFRIAKYYVNGEVAATRVYELGDKMEDLKSIYMGDNNDQHVSYWTLNGERVDFDTMVCNDNYEFHAVLEQNETHTVTLCFTTDTTSDEIEKINAGRFLVDTSSVYVSATGNNSSNVTITSQFDTAIKVDFHITNVFEISSDYALYIVSDKEYDIQRTNFKSDDFTATGWNYSGSFTIQGAPSDATIYFVVEPIVYNLRLYRNASTSDRYEVTIENCLTYGCTINLNELLTEEQIFTFTRNNNSGAHFNGFYTKEVEQGVQYFDSDLNMLKTWTETGIEWNGNNYNYTTNYDSKTKTFTLYVGFNFSA